MKEFFECNDRLLTSARNGAVDIANTEETTKYCRNVYEAGFSPVCPILCLPLFLNDEIPQEHKDGIDMARDLLRRSHVLVVCGHTVDEQVKNDIAVVQRMNITATTLDGILTEGQRPMTNKQFLRRLMVPP